MDARRLLAMGMLAAQGIEVPQMKDPAVIEPYHGERGQARARAKAKRKAKLRKLKALDPVTGNFKEKEV